jgi:para-aminobenzoate synthetase component 1
MVYKSGGGITIDSNVESEYNELINKIYIPQ